MEKDNKRFNIDYILIFIILALGAISVISLYTVQDILLTDSSNVFYKDQIMWYVLGFIVIGIMMFFDYDNYRKIAWILYGIGLFSLAGVYFLPFALELNNARGWYNVGFGTVQPAEFMKIILLITVAHVITSHHEKRLTSGFRDDVWLLVKVALVTLPPVLLVFAMPDVGSAVVLTCIVAFMILVSGIRWRILLIIAAMGGLIIGAFIGLYFLFPDFVQDYLSDTIFRHVFERLEAWFNPQQNVQGSGYQINNTLLAIGSGQLFGKGLMNFDVTNIPVRESDMVFSVIGEQFGFVGSSILIALFFFLIYRIIQTALACKDPFASYICTGVVGMITYQVIQNIGMSLKILPISGLPLPFISAGGSSLIAYMMAIGLVLNIYSHIRTYMFDD
ncbi:cell division protein FtsW, lipid II flippase [Salinibacillus kushneri]|uniref:Cell division protein FtsW, lipid II flippase n=1 Tax=Salinibacillus kushneri TaxID=237682 RepID=A0A1I0J142_9BACI|nr:FtsW/RodA/SpoVE family cell cycle protein [Salinibacillus kushneri]SEU02734.1 cell division protein FtsW, lipid II flippase [Salinibacillus kushneri]